MKHKTNFTKMNASIKKLKTYNYIERNIFMCYDIFKLIMYIYRYIRSISFTKNQKDFGPEWKMPVINVIIYLN